MHVVAIVVLILVLTTPSKSSQSCMTKTEARQHFGWVHIYWQGKYRCWDATPARQHHLIDKVQQKIDQPKWHEATPGMLPDQEPIQMVMVIISIALTLAVIEVLFAGMIYQRVASKRNT